MFSVFKRGTQLTAIGLVILAMTDFWHNYSWSLQIRYCEVYQFKKFCVWDVVVTVCGSYGVWSLGCEAVGVCGSRSITELQKSRCLGLPM